MPLAENSSLDQGDIYWITLPDRGGREQHGRRPCIVMSRTALNTGNPVVVVPMTSQTRKANSYNIQIPASEIVRDINNNSNIVDSVAQCGQVFMCDKRKFEDRMGKLSYSAVLAVQLGLSFVFDIR